jgi:hypothetical protein
MALAPRTVPAVDGRSYLDRTLRLLRGHWLMPYAALSLSLHVAGLALVRARAVPPPPAFEPTTSTLSGETLDVEPAPPDPGEDSPGVADETATATPAVDPGRRRKATEPASTRAPAELLAARAAAVGGAPAASDSQAGGKPAAFGAVGVRFATDLATTFTRAFPQAASADGVWGSVSFGNAGTADVTLVLDESGHLTGHTIGGSPSTALRRGVERTLALLGPRTFTARGAVTKLRVAARVGRDDVHDGLHGDVFALSGGSFSGNVGTAFFALPAPGGGRRIDVELRLLP